MNQRTLMSRCQRPGLNPRQESSGLVSSFGAAFDCIWDLERERIRDRCRPDAIKKWSSAKGEVLSQTGFAGFFVFRAHVASSVGESFNGGIEIDAMARFDFVGGDHDGCPGFDCAKSTALDAGNLDVTGHRITRHAEMMLQGGLGGVFGDLR